MNPKCPYCQTPEATPIHAVLRRFRCSNAGCRMPFIESNTVPAEVVPKSLVEPESMAPAPGESSVPVAEQSDPAPEVAAEQPPEPVPHAEQVPPSPPAARPRRRGR